MPGYADPHFDTLSLHAGAGPDPATGRGKRGRRRKEEEPAAGDETPSSVIGTAAEQGRADEVFAALEVLYGLAPEDAASELAG
jgi:hypothetical protein